MKSFCIPDFLLSRFLQYNPLYFECLSNAVKYTCPCSPIGCIILPISGTYSVFSFGRISLKDSPLLFPIPPVKFSGAFSPLGSNFQISFTALPNLREPTLHSLYRMPFLGYLAYTF